MKFNKPVPAECVCLDTSRWRISPDFTWAFCIDCLAEEMANKEAIVSTSREVGPSLPLM